MWREHWNWIIGTPAIMVSGSRKKKEKQIASWETGALIISYSTLRKTKTAQGFINEILQQDPEAVIVDEIHHINGRTTATAKAVFKFRNIPIRFALTGTLVRNKNEEVWCTLHFLYPKYFSSYWRFVDQYFKTWEIRPKNCPTVVTQIGAFKPGMETKLWSILDSFSTRRTRAEVMPWLPEKDFQKITLEPTQDQIRYIDELEQWYETEDLIVENILTRLIRTRQICNDPKLVGLRGTSPKSEWVLDYIEEFPERSIIIFSKFTEYLKLLHEQITKKFTCLFIHGGMKQQEIEQQVIDFQNKKHNILLLQIECGKEALTLDRADAIIFTDKYPPISDITQAEDRFVATTKERANKLHIIYDLVMQGTYEEVIQAIITKGKSETDLINNYKKHLERRTKWQHPSQ